MIRNLSSFTLVCSFIFSFDDPMPFLIEGHSNQEIITPNTVQ